MHEGQGNSVVIADQYKAQVKAAIYKNLDGDNTKARKMNILNEDDDCGSEVQKLLSMF